MVKWSGLGRGCSITGVGGVSSAGDEDGDGQDEPAPAPLPSGPALGRRGRPLRPGPAASPLRGSRRGSIAGGGADFTLVLLAVGLVVAVVRAAAAGQPLPVRHAPVLRHQPRITAVFVSQYK